MKDMLSLARILIQNSVDKSASKECIIVCNGKLVSAGKIVYSSPGWARRGIIDVFRWNMFGYGTKLSKVEQANKILAIIHELERRSIIKIVKVSDLDISSTDMWNLGSFDNTEKEKLQKMLTGKDEELFNLAAEILEDKWKKEGK